MKKLYKLLICSISLFSLCSCTKYHKFKEVEEYIYETDTYTELDYDFVDNYFATTNDNWGGGCSAISMIINGNRVVGRNMDLNISNKCAYIVRTNVEDKYETMGLSYTFRDISPDYKVAKRKGINDTYYKILPFMCDDVINSEGLHVELNMRNAEWLPNGMDLFACSGTNPEALHRVYMFELCQYIALNCKNIEEVKTYVNSLDIYSQEHYWNYCFLISDANNDAILLEFARDEIYWIEPDENGVIAHTNFYLNGVCYALQEIKTGLGRYNELISYVQENKLRNKNDLMELMKKIQYSSFYLDYDECKNEHFDPRSENIMTLWWASSSILLSDEFEYLYREISNEYTSEIRKMTRQEKQDANEYWESTFTEVVDCKEKIIWVRFFEDDDKVYRITFNDYRKIVKTESIF